MSSEETFSSWPRQERTARTRTLPELWAEAESVERSSEGFGEVRGAHVPGKVQTQRPPEA